MRNFMVESGHVITVALIKFEHLDWGIRYKTLVLKDDQYTEDEIIEYANKERINGENFTITLKITDLTNNLTIGIKEIDE